MALAPFVGNDGFWLSIRLGLGTVSADVASDLALAVHERATNATKYGAPSEHGGRVRLTGCVEERNGRPAMCLEWREADGPAAQRPDRQGVGSRLLRVIDERQGGGWTWSGKKRARQPHLPADIGSICAVWLPILQRRRPLLARVAHFGKYAAKGGTPLAAKVREEAPEKALSPSDGDNLMLQRTKFDRCFRAKTGNSMAMSNGKNFRG